MEKNMFKHLQYCALALVTCTGSLAANFYDQGYSNDCYEQPPRWLNNDCCYGQNNYSWKIGADFLYLKPSVDDTYFVIGSPVTTAFPNGTRYHNDFEFTPAFRVFGGFSFCDCNKEIVLSYTRLSQTQQRTITGDFLWATIGRADLVSAFENYTGSASSDLDLLYQRIDALYSQQVANCCGLNFD